MTPALAIDADRRLDPLVSAYVAAAAGDSATANEAAWARLRLRPRMLRDVSAVSTAVTVLDQPLTAPIMVAPTAMHRLVCDGGELATARGAADAGALYVVSMAATVAIAEIATAVPAGHRWMQVYVRRDRGLTRRACETAAAAGCSAMVLTVDAPVQRSARPPGGPLNGTLPLPNLAPGEDAPDVFDVADDYAPDLTFDDLATIRGWTGLPLVVKGVVRGDDAVRCLDAGADAIAVSNHGGRQVAGCVATADALADVVAAVGGRAEVYVDGGIRSGSDVLRALALGARAVLIGRPVVWGLAVDGAAGVTGVLDALRTDLERTMGLCGVTDATDVPRDLVAASSTR